MILGVVTDNIEIIISSSLLNGLVGWWKFEGVVWLLIPVVIIIMLTLMEMPASSGDNGFIAIRW